MDWKEYICQSRVAEEAGDSSRRKNSHKEEDLQQACVAWWGLQHGRRKVHGEEIRDLLHHSPNGGTRHISEAVRFKRMGTRAGFPDLVLMLPNAAYPFLGIELKTTDRGSDQRASQRDMQRKLEAAGGKYVIVRSFEEFKAVVDEYLSTVKFD